MNVDRKLVKAVAALLSQSSATHPDFFMALSDALYAKGYRLEARQRGIAGTHICIVKNETLEGV